jgi:hypothetical protein
MLSHIPCRLRAIAPVLILSVVLGIFTPAVALARNQYELADQNEGDPGDGVLDPAIDSQPSVWDSKHPLPIYSTTGRGRDAGWALPSSAFHFVSLPFSGGLPGQSVVLVLPRAWLRSGATALLQQGRWHDAP